MAGDQGVLGIGMAGYAFMGRAERPLPGGGGRQLGPVTVAGGALGSFEATRFASGHDDATGYEHTFTHEVRDLLEAIAAGRDPAPSFADGLHVQQVLDAVQRSAASGSTWQEVAP
jgi:predicted dehydrogenase